MLYWLIIGVLLALDCQNIVSGFRRVERPCEAACGDYIIVVPIYGHPRYLQNLDFLSEYKDKVLLAFGDNPEMATFGDELRAEGWRVVMLPIPAICGVPSLMKLAVHHVTTKYIIRLDGDTFSEIDPGRAVEAMRVSGLDLASVKVLPSRRQSIVECLQGVEYDVSMIGRQNRPWLTSGACMVADASAMRRMYRVHSEWFPGEDMEMGRIAKHLRMKVGHIDWKVYTVVPESWGALWKQRIGWWAGSFRHSVINADKNWRYPMWALYTLGLVWIGLLGKISSISTGYRLIPLLICVYTLTTLVSNWKVRSPWMILFPYYALISVMVIPWFGLVRHFNLWRQWRTHSPSVRYLIGYRRAPKPGPRGGKMYPAAD